jgi:hypothetical protein
MVDPAALNYLLSQACSETCLASGGLTINNNLTINNDIYMSAVSGDATVSGNQTAGNASSGNASVMLNLINIINSIITSGQSFVGTINIYGSLDGDILLPPEIMASLLTPSASGQSELAGYNQTTYASITNNVVMTATSGDALVSGNAAAGDASSGLASNNSMIYNLVNNLAIGDRALIVFVNVMGQWTGFIINASAGTNATILGGMEPASYCDVCGLPIYSDFTNNLSINNDIYLTANTGNAAVLADGATGNAISGNASTYLNLINIINSNLVFSDWFGVLFINVFGSWNGSFGVDTAAGNAQNEPTDTQAEGETTKKATVAFQFVPNNPLATTAVSSNDTTDNDSDDSEAVVLGDTENTAAANQGYANWLFFLLALVMLSSLAVQRVRAESQA